MRDVLLSSIVILRISIISSFFQSNVCKNIILLDSLLSEIILVKFASSGTTSVDMRITSRSAVYTFDLAVLWRVVI